MNEPNSHSLETAVQETHLCDLTLKLHISVKVAQFTREDSTHGHRSLFVPCFLQARLHPLGPFLSQKGRFKQLLIKRGQPRNPLNE